MGQFDITLALGLLYHLKHPILALENLYQVTKELLVIETAIMPPERTPGSFIHPLGEQQVLAPSARLRRKPGRREGTGLQLVFAERRGAGGAAQEYGLRGS